MGPHGRHHCHHRARQGRPLRSSANVHMTSTDRPMLARDDPAGAPGTAAYAGVAPTLEGRALHDALRAEIAAPWLLLVGRRPRWLRRDAELARRADLLWTDAGRGARLMFGLVDGAGDRHRAVPGLRLPTLRSHPVAAPSPARRGPARWVGPLVLVFKVYHRYPPLGMRPL